MFERERERESGRRRWQLNLWSSAGSIGDMLRHHQYWQAVVINWLQVIQMPVTVSLHRRMGGEQHSIFCTTMTIMVGFTLSRCKLASDWNWTFSSKATLILTRAWGLRMIGLRNGAIILDSWGQVGRTHNFNLTFNLIRGKPELNLECFQKLGKYITENNYNHEYKTSFRCCCCCYIGLCILIQFKCICSNLYSPKSIFI